MQWHVSIGPQQYVAESVEQLASWIREGRIQWSSLIYHPGLARWVAAHEVPELRSLFAQHQPITPAKSTGIALSAMGCVLGLIVLLAVMAGLVKSASRRDTVGAADSRTEITPERKSTAIGTPASELRQSEESDRRTTADYRSGYERGRTEGADHAHSGAGMPIPLGMNWMADLQAQAAQPADAAAWKNGFKDGFEAGFRSVAAFDRNESDWEQLSWQNARAGVRLYDYGGKHDATIRSVDRSSGIMIVQYGGGEVEPKELEAVAPYWWIRKE